MLTSKLVPNEVTYNALLLACTGMSPDCAYYAVALDAACQEKVSSTLFRQALMDNAWPDMLLRDGTLLDLTDHSAGSAMLAVLWWLAEVVPGKLFRNGSPDLFQIKADQGMSQESHKTYPVRASVQNLLAACRIPCSSKEGLLQVDLRQFDEARLRALFPE